MKILADGTKVSSRSYYFLLDWNDKNFKTYMSEKFKKDKLTELTIEEYSILWLQATTSEYNNLVKVMNNNVNSV